MIVFLALPATTRCLAQLHAHLALKGNIQVPVREPAMSVKVVASQPLVKKIVSSVLEEPTLGLGMQLARNVKAGAIVKL